MHHQRQSKTKRDLSTRPRHHATRNAELPFTSLERVACRVKRRLPSIDIRDSRQALLESNRYDQRNIYLSATPFHVVATGEPQAKDEAEKSIEQDLRLSARKDAEEDELTRILAMRGRLPPKELVDRDKELVEGLEGWTLKKGLMLSVRSPEPNTETEEELGSTFKTQPRPLGFTKRNTISLDVLRQVVTNRKRPSLKLSPRPALVLPIICKSRLPSIAPSEDLDDDMKSSPHAVSSRKQSVLEDVEEDTAMSPLRTTIGELMMTGETSKNVAYETKTRRKYQRLVVRLEEKRKKELRLLVEKGNMLREIAQLRDRVREIHATANGKRSASQRPNVSPAAEVSAPVSTNVSPKMGAKFAKALAMASPLAGKLIETGTHMVRERRMQMVRSWEEQIAGLRQKVETAGAKAGRVRQKIDYLKVAVAQLRQEQCEHYHGLLSVGTDTRQEGLVWIVKAIWGLSANVNISKLPAYLGEKSVEFLFAYGRKEMELEQLKKSANIGDETVKAQDADASPGPERKEPGQDENTEAKRLNKQIDAVRQALREMRDEECKRIAREFRLHNYALKYNVTFDTILVALFGIEYAKREIDKRSRAKETAIMGSSRTTVGAA